MPRRTPVKELQKEETVVSSPIRRSSRLNTNSPVPTKVITRRNSASEVTTSTPRATRSRRSSFSQELDSAKELLIEKKKASATTTRSRRGSASLTIEEEEPVQKPKTRGRKSVAESTEVEEPSVKITRTRSGSGSKKSEIEDETLNKKQVLHPSTPLKKSPSSEAINNTLEAIDENQIAEEVEPGNTKKKTKLEATNLDLSVINETSFVEEDGTPEQKSEINLSLKKEEKGVATKSVGTKLEKESIETENEPNEQEKPKEKIVSPKKSEETEILYSSGSESSFTLQVSTHVFDDSNKNESGASDSNNKENICPKSQTQETECEPMDVDVSVTETFSPLKTNSLKSPSVSKSFTEMKKITQDIQQFLSESITNSSEKEQEDEVETKEESIENFEEVKKVNTPMKQAVVILDHVEFVQKELKASSVSQKQPTPRKSVSPKVDIEKTESPVKKTNTPVKTIENLHAKIESGAKKSSPKKQTPVKSLASPKTKIENITPESVSLALESPQIKITTAPPSKTPASPLKDAQVIVAGTKKQTPTKDSDISKKDLNGVSEKILDKKMTPKVNANTSLSEEDLDEEKILENDEEEEENLQISQDDEILEETKIEDTKSNKVISNKCPETDIPEKNFVEDKNVEKSVDIEVEPKPKKEENEKTENCDLSKSDITNTENLKNEEKTVTPCEVEESEQDLEVSYLNESKQQTPTKEEDTSELFDSESDPDYASSVKKLRKQYNSVSDDEIITSKKCLKRDAFNVFERSIDSEYRISLSSTEVKHDSFMELIEVSDTEGDTNVEDENEDNSDEVFATNESVTETSGNNLEASVKSEKSEEHQTSTEKDKSMLVPKPDEISILSQSVMRRSTDRTSITLQETVKAGEDEKNLSGRIHQVVDLFCAGIKNNADVSINVSLEYAGLDSGSENEEMNKSDLITISMVASNIAEKEKHVEAPGVEEKQVEAHAVEEKQVEADAVEEKQVEAHAIEDKQVEAHAIEEKVSTCSLAVQEKQVKAPAEKEKQVKTPRGSKRRKICPETPVEEISLIKKTPKEKSTSKNKQKSITRAKSSEEEDLDEENESVDVSASFESFFNNTIVESEDENDVSWKPNEDLSFIQSELSTDDSNGSDASDEKTEESPDETEELVKEEKSTIKKNKKLFRLSRYDVSNVFKEQEKQETKQNKDKKETKKNKKGKAPLFIATESTKKIMPETSEIKKKSNKRKHPISEEIAVKPKTVKKNDKVLTDVIKPSSGKTKRKLKPVVVKPSTKSLDGWDVEIIS